jgi:hypothetical protein
MSPLIEPPRTYGGPKDSPSRRFERCYGRGDDCSILSSEHSSVGRRYVPRNRQLMIDTGLTTLTPARGGAEMATHEGSF